MLKLVEKFEKFMTMSLIFLMVIVIFFGSLDLIVLIGKDLLSPPKFLLDIKKLLEIFGGFFMILIGLELLETIKTYLSREQVHVEIVLLVAMIAIARKVIILDIKKMTPLTLIGIAVIIIALAGGYFLVRYSHRKFPNPPRADLK
jgi:uncharacterized membrane protein (DUF373 family)